MTCHRDGCRYKPSTAVPGCPGGPGNPLVKNEALFNEAQYVIYIYI